MQYFRIGALYLCKKINLLTTKNFNGIMTEEKNRLKILSIKKDCVSLQANQVYPDMTITKTK